MLKNKDLLHKDKDIEIGFMSKKQSDRLIVTLYITPERDIESLNWNVQCDDALTVESEPHSFITYVRTKKQEKIFFTVTVNRPAFSLPRVEFTYTAGQENHRVSVFLPCAFHKFLYIKQSDSDLTEQFNRSNSIIRGEQVPYSKKVLKSLDSLRDYFQSMAILNKGQANEQGEMSYGGVAVYKQHQFPVRISVKPNQFCYVQGIVSASDETRNQTAVIEYFISTVTHLLMKEIQ